MRNLKSQPSAVLRVLLPALLIATLFSSPSYAAVADRIPETIDSNQKLALKGNVHGWAQARYDLGRADASRMMHGVSLAFQPSAAQQKDLNNLLAQQQDRSSPNYHKWLTPAQFADRFGMTRNDIKRITGWLQSQGFAVTSVANSRNEIFFDGTVSQIETTFSTEMHTYQVNGEMHLANATDPSVPSALAGSVMAIGHLHDFSPKPRAQVRPHLTSYISGNHFLSPGDFATIYDLKPLYTASSTCCDGTGQKIAVIGQTTVSTTDLNNFRTAAGLPASTVTMTTVNGKAAQCAGDEGEADLDIEWAGGVAKGAQIIFLQAGLVGTDTCTSRSNSVWNALDYAVQNNVAPIITTSYGFCESGLGTAFVTALQTTVQQGNTQGQTVIAASGDAGAADCDPSSSTTAVMGLAVDVPASIPEVTGMGGTYFNADAPNCTTACPPGANPPYWAAAGASSDTVSSSLEYIGETAWNDSAFGGGFAASGGGASLGSALGFFAKPTWQTGTGVPADGKRDVPDLSLDASADHDGYLFCSEDVGASTCTSGFRTGAGGNFSIVGGTSAAAPTFAAILALVNQYIGNTSATGLGNINPNLYTFATNNPSPYHDITTGSNIVTCASGSPGCPTTAPFQYGFSAGAGYDQVTGLGSVDGFAFAQAWAATLANFSLAPSPSSLTAAAGQSSTSTTITITPLKGFSGTVTFSCSAGLPTGATCVFNTIDSTSSSLVIQTAANMAAASNVSVTVKGTSGVVSSTTTVTLTITATSETFSLTSDLTGSALSVAQGSTSTAVNLTVASSTGFIVSSATTLPVTYSCSGLPSESSCIFSPSGATTSTAVSFTIKTTAPSSAQRSSARAIPIFYAALLPGLLGIMFIGGGRRRSLRGMRVLGLIAVLGFSTLWMASCGGSSSKGPSDPGTAKGTSTVTVNATTGGAAPITAALPFSFTVN